MSDRFVLASESNLLVPDLSDQLQLWNKTLGNQIPSTNSIAYSFSPTRLTK